MLSRGLPVTDVVITPYFYLVWNGVFYFLITRYEQAPNAAADNLTQFAKTHEITAREQEVLGLVVVGKKNQEIANELYISLSTVKTHLQNIFQKTYVENRTSLIHQAQK